jgi:hypothetical protein
MRSPMIYVPSVNQKDPPSAREYDRKGVSRSQPIVVRTSKQMQCCPYTEQYKRCTRVWARKRTLLFWYAYARTSNLLHNRVYGYHLYVRRAEAVCNKLFRKLRSGPSNSETSARRPLAVR